MPSTETIVEDSALAESSSRVCDNCIRKKVKCDLERPTCSRCFERGYACAYSATRRKPGPQRGSRRRVSLGEIGQRRTSTRRQDRSSQHAPEEAPDLILPSSNLSQPSNTIPGAPPSSVSGSPSTGSAIQQAELTIFPAEENYLLDQFAVTLHNSIPLFSRPENLATSLHSRDLIYTIIILTAKLICFKFAAISDVELNAHIELLLSADTLEEDLLGSRPSLDQLRKACLLSFYEFHQFPGQQAWMRAGKLVRVAYWIGLDRFDNPRQVFPDRTTMGQDDANAWRLLWWSIYRLDSYTNLASGAPYMIDEQTMNVALMQDPETGFQVDIQAVTSTGNPFWSSLVKSLWQLIPAVMSCSEQTMLFNLHLITVTAMRQIGRVTRMHFHSLADDTNEQLSDAKHHLSALRLALPTHYLSPMRNALRGESPLTHHQRLVTVLHLQISKLLIAIANCTCGGSGEEWINGWQEIVEAAQDIASISEQWNSSYSLLVDPAICIILFSALIFIHIHKKSEYATLPHIPVFDHSETVVLLHLEHFSESWTQAKMLILSYKSVEQSLKGPLSGEQIRHILSHFEVPLHPNWLQFLLSI